MATHSTAAYSALVKSMKKNRQSGRRMAMNATRMANVNRKGAGNKVAMMKAVMRYMTNHPNSAKAQKMAVAITKKK
jgi:hypothetical protein